MRLFSLGFPYDCIQTFIYHSTFDISTTFLLCRHWSWAYFCSHILYFAFCSINRSLIFTVNVIYARLWFPLVTHLQQHIAETVLYYYRYSSLACYFEASVRFFFWFLSVTQGDPRLPSNGAVIMNKKEKVGSNDTKTITWIMAVKYKCITSLTAESKVYFCRIIN